eukprot:Em0013g712a
MNTWDEATRVARDTETKARILGVQSQMKTFSFMFGVYLAEGQNVAGMVVRTLEKLRSSEAFDLFWQKVTDSSETHGVGEPDLPRPLEQRAHHKMAFSTPFGVFQFKIMPFGRHGAPLHSRPRVQGMDGFAGAYLDELIIHSSFWTDHIRLVLTRLLGAGLTSKLSKWNGKVYVFGVFHRKWRRGT